MRTQAVSWRRAAVALATTVGLLGLAVVVVRSDGLPAVDATVSRATRWFVHRDTGRIVLVDGYAGRSLARLDAGDGTGLAVAEGPAGAFLLDPSIAEARRIDTAALRLGTGVPVAPLASSDQVNGVGLGGLVVVDPPSSEATIVPPSGDSVPFEVETGAQTKVAADGGVWSVVNEALVRTTSTRTTSTPIGTGEVELTTVGGAAFVVDEVDGRARFNDGRWVDLPGDPSEIVVQQPGPPSPCAWVASDDVLWCVGRSGVEQTVEIPGLDVDGADLLGVAGDAAALVHRATRVIDRLDLRGARILADGDGAVASVPQTAELALTATADLVWIDDTAGDLVWAVNPWSLEAIRKNDTTSPLLGETGEVIEEGSSVDSGGPTRPAEGDPGQQERQPDDNGIDDPPVALDDPVTSRVASAIPIAVTANDFDPDGEAVAVVSVDSPAHGTTEVASASVVVYRPDAGFVGVDRFRYTIADGNGTEASATVVIELVAADATNRVPVAQDDEAETGLDTPVVIDVLLNDLDPERDALRIASFTQADVGGTISQTLGPSGLQALRYQPPPGASGTATFTYRPVDAFDAIGEPATVTIDIAEAGSPNRAPITQPDAVRLRRNIPQNVNVLANDRDPDGDTLTLDKVEPLPNGIEVEVAGSELVITSRAGSQPLTPLAYLVDDGHGHVTLGRVLVVTLSDVEPNQPPVAYPDIATAVVGEDRFIDVLANDTDPDGDPLFLVDVDAPAQGGQVSVVNDEVRFVPASIGDNESRTVRFRYTVGDGNGHLVEGDVAVSVLAEPLALPPFARDDAASTEQDVRVTIDVLGNDGDPSGERPVLTGRPGCPAGGRASVTPDQRIVFNPPPGQTGVFRCTYEVANQRGLRASASIVVSVHPPAVTNEPPVVVSEQIRVDLGTTQPVDVLANDSDPEGGALTLLSWTRPALGSATRDGSTIYFTAGNVVGQALITYLVGDPDGGVSTGRVIINVQEPDPISPTAVDDGLQVYGPSSPQTFDVLANDFDPDGDHEDLRLVSVSPLGGGATATIQDGQVVISPDASFLGNFVARYEIVDADGRNSFANVTLSVIEQPNRAPVATGELVEVVNGGTVTVPVLLNETDADGDVLTVRLLNAPPSSLGTADVNSDGTIDFEAEPGASGQVDLTYEVSDGALTATAVLTVVVLPCGAALPVAPDVFLQTGYQQPISVDLRTYARNGLVVDVDPPLGAPAGVITPAAGENGNIVIGYAVINACRLRDTGTLTIDVNQDPVAQPVSFQIGRTEQRLVSTVELASDAEPLQIVSLDGNPSWVSVVDPGAGLNVDPRGAAATTVTFTVVVEDPGGLQASVPVTIEVIDRPPVANPDSVDASGGPVTFRPLDNDVEPDGDSIRIQALPETATFDDGTVATITLMGNDQVRFDPNGGTGIATFQYTIVDGAGQVSAPATITVRVNRPPQADDQQVTVVGGVPTTVPLAASDPDGDALVVTLLDVPPALSVTLDGLSLVIVAPVVTRPTTYRFDVLVVDPFQALDRATIRVDVDVPPETTTTTSTTAPP